MVSAIVVGALINVAVAIGCAIRAQTQPGPVVEMSQPAAVEVARSHVEQMLEVFGAKAGEEVRAFWRAHVADQFTSPGKASVQVQPGYRECRIGLMTPPLYVPGESEPVAGITHWTIDSIEAGWPMKALRRTTRTAQDSATWFRRFQLFQSPRVVQSTGSTLFILPYEPLWLGFIVNAFFYGGLLLLLVTAPRALRRRWRERRGLCPACAYPVGESDRCSECGEPRPVPESIGS